jgi:hypothetical protein
MNVQTERRRRSRLITPGEAERPEGVMRLPYLPPTITLIDVSLESFLTDSVTLTMADGKPKYTPYDDTEPEIEAGDIWFQVPF